MDIMSLLRVAEFLRRPGIRDFLPQMFPKASDGSVIPDKKLIRNVLESYTGEKVSDSDIDMLSEAFSGGSNNGGIDPYNPDPEELQKRIKTLERTSTGGAGETLINFLEKGAVNSLNAVADYRDLKTNRLAASLINRANRRAQSQFNQGVLEDAYNDAANKLAIKAAPLTLAMRTSANTLQDVYDKFESDRDMGKGRALAELSPMSGGEAMLQNGERSRSARRAQRLAEKQKGNK